MSKKRDPLADLEFQWEIYTWKHPDGIQVNNRYKRITSGDHAGALICPRCDKICNELVPFPGAFDICCQECTQVLTQLSLLDKGSDHDHAD